jgi:hypothetical protein
MSTKVEEAEAARFLESLLGKTLQVTVPDGELRVRGTGAEAMGS